MAVKECAICGRDFETGGNGKVCDACHVGRCAVCGAEIRLSQYQLKQVMDGKGVSCSDKCRGELTKRNLMEREGIENVSQRDALKSRSFRRTCKLCGNEFDGGRTARYCPDCKKVTCPVCGKEFEPGPAQFSKYVKQGWLTCGNGKCRAEMTKRNLMEREGIENVSQRSDVKEKIRETRLNDSDETKAKRSAALSDSCSKKEVIAARARTNMEKTGYEWPLQNPNVRVKAIEASRSDSAKAKRAETNFERYGVSNPYQLHRATAGSSKVELHFGKMLADMGIGYDVEVPVGGRYFDFRVGNTLVEINPWIWHNATFHPFSPDLSLDCCRPDYHLSKTRIASDAGYRLIHVFDWDDQRKVVELLAPKTSIGARKLRLERIDDYGTVARFLNSHHLQGATRSAMVSYGLLRGDDIVSVMTFGRSRFNKNFDYEMLRYCTKPGVAVSGGAERLFSAFVREYDGSIVSYSDNAKFDGLVYERLGFSLESEGVPTVHWYNPKTERHITDSLLRARGVDQLLGTSYGKGARNDELMLKEGFVEIYDCGQSRWVYRRDG